MNKMKILIIGSGGREHTIAWKLSQSPLVEKIFIAPGNAGTALVGENVNIEVNEFEKLAEFAKKEKISLTIIGPEDPLVKGIINFFEEKNLNIFGPNERAAIMEGSKTFTRPH